jgi:hypothetical protein
VTLIDDPSWVLSSQPDIHTMKEGLQSKQLTVEDGKKPIFVFTSDTIV